MGIDLTLIPVDHMDAPAFGHMLLPMERNSDLFALILDLPSRDAPLNFSCYLSRCPEGEHCYGRVAQDDYGEPLRMVLVADLLAIPRLDLVAAHARNRAVWAFTGATDHEWVVLFWH